MFYVKQLAEDITPATHKLFLALADQSASDETQWLAAPSNLAAFHRASLGSKYWQNAAG